MIMQSDSAKEASSEMTEFVDAPAWVAPALEFADAALRDHPPACPPPTARQEALMILDGPLHLEAAPRFRGVYEFFERRMRRAIKEIEESAVTSGTRIWRLYNHGFVVRTPSVTLGMDLVRGWLLPGSGGVRRGIADDLAARLADQIDVMTLSHNHADHVDPAMCELLFERGVPVVAAPDILLNITGQPLLSRPERVTRVPAAGVGDADLHRLRPLRLARGKEIECVVYPGHQGDAIPNNVYLFRTGEGCAVAHTGDQHDEPDLEWIDRIGDHHDVDVLLVNCWTNDMRRMVSGVRPRLTVTGHELEMSHGPDHREAYWRSFQIFRDGAVSPSLVMGWGESFDYVDGAIC